jgi:hypothetical protein
MSRTTALWLLVVMVFATTLVFTPTSRAQAGNFANLDVRGALLTRINDVNNLGVMVGRYDDQDGTHGFVFANGSFTTIDYPGAGATAVIGVNDFGDVVGRFTTNGVDHGFLLSHGAFLQIDFPGALSTQCHGINRQGQIVGRYLSLENPANGKGMGLAHEHGFFLDDGHFSSIDFPDADTTDAWKVTDAGDVVGDWSEHGSLQSGSLHGYILHAGEFRSIDLPDVLGTAPRKVNLAGQLIGIYLNDKKLPGSATSATMVDHAFVLSGGVQYLFDFPGAISTDGNALNDSGLVVGSYTDVSGREHGYSALVSHE